MTTTGAIRETRPKVMLKLLMMRLCRYTHTSAHASDGTTKAPNDLCYEKLAETLEPSSRLSQPLRSVRSLQDGKVFKLDSQWGSPQSTLRAQQNQALYSFL